MNSKYFQNLKVYFSSILLALILSAVSLQATTAASRVVLTNASIIDGNGGPLLAGGTVEILGARILKVYAGPYRSPENDGARVFDLAGGYLMPGLWNNHSHLADLLPDPKGVLENEPVAQATIRAGRNAMDALRAGFTSLRSAGESDYMDVAWRDAFNAGVFVGPRILAAGPSIAAVGGHGTESNGPAVEETASAADVRRAVTEHVRRGVDLVKIMVDEMNAEQIKAAVETAHEHGIKVIGHAAEPGAGIAVKLGIDGIEHGYGLTDRTLRLMAEKGTFYDPTIVCNLSADYIAEREKRISAAGFKADAGTVKGRVMVAYADERSKTMAAQQRRILTKAVAAGVKVISGSDSNPIDEIGLLEIEQMVFSGVSEMDAILAATRNSADMMGLLDEVGTIEPGKYADLIVLRSNPLDNISNLRSLERVFKNGLPVRLDVNEGRKSFWDLYFLDR